LGQLTHSIYLAYGDCGVEVFSGRQLKIVFCLLHELILFLQLPQLCFFNLRFLQQHPLLYLHLLVDRADARFDIFGVVVDLNWERQLSENLVLDVIIHSHGNVCRALLVPSHLLTVVFFHFFNK
jgi:hypothetical protein